MSSSEGDSQTDQSSSQLDLALRLLSRGDRQKDGLAALRRAYPTAPDAMIDSAAFHLFVDGPDALIGFLAEAELLITEPHDFDYGASWHVLYHVYNWLQFQSLLPDVRSDVVDQLDELRAAVAADDREGIVAAAEELRVIFDAGRPVPDV